MHICDWYESQRMKSRAERDDASDDLVNESHKAYRESHRDSCLTHAHEHLEYNVCTYAVLRSRIITWVCKWEILFVTYADVLSIFFSL